MFKLKRTNLNNLINNLTVESRLIGFESTGKSNLSYYTKVI